MNAFEAIAAEHGIGIDHHFCGGVYAKETRIPAGKWLIQHVHAHDHLSVLASGAVQLTVDGSSRMIIGPVCVNIRAGEMHKVEAVTDVVWFCVHATDCTDADEIDMALIAKEG